MKTAPRGRHGKEFVGGGVVPRRPQATLHCIGESDAKEAIEAWSEQGAAAADGWSPAEWKLLPRSWRQKMAELLTLVEESGEFPEMAYHVPVIMLDKGKGPEPLKQRPISAAPILYRLWSSIRYKHMKTWLLEWAHPNATAPGKNWSMLHVHELGASGLCHLSDLCCHDSNNVGA